MWRNQFGSDDDVVGRAFDWNDARFEVIGVAPVAVEFLAPGAAFWIPTDFAWAERGQQGRFISVVGRLAPGVGPAQAQDELNAMAAALREEFPDFNASWGINVVPFEEQVKGDVRATLLVLLASVILLLLIACANVANLMAVRSATRRREVAVRASLGATQGRIARELLTESLLLAALGGALGLAFAWATMRGLLAAVPAAVDVPRLENVSLDWRVMGFGAAVALATGVLFGLAPVLESLEAIPGVHEAGAITFLPLGGIRSATGFWPLDRPPPPPGEHQSTAVQAFQGDYFRAMGVPLLAGSIPDGPLREDGPIMAVVNRTLADRTWPGESPLGKRLSLSWRDSRSDEPRTEVEVAGVVGDVRELGVDTAAIPGLYLPARQFPTFSLASVVVRGTGDPGAILREVPARIHQLDPRMPVADLRPMDDVVAGSVARPRLTAMLMASFAGLALLLAGIGLYGVVAYTVSVRVHELGVRRALGARAGNVVRLVLRDGLALAAVGVGIGTLAALAATRVLRSLLYEVSPTDPLTFTGMAAFLLAVALTASLIPAVRAARVSPTEAIRED